MRIKIVFLLAFLSVAVFCFASDPAEGFWFSIDDKTGDITAGWEIYQVNGKLCGRILSTPDTAPDAIAERCKESYSGFPVSGTVNQMKVLGTPWIFGLSMEKSGQWIGGNVIDPEDGKIYKCKIIFHTADGKKFKSDTLEMRGEIGLGIGRSQYWKKTDIETASSLYALP